VFFVAQSGKQKLIFKIINNYKGKVMSLLNALKLSTTKKPTHIPPVLQRRNKLLKRLWEQIELAKAEETNSTFTVNKIKSIKGIDGIKRSVEMPKRIKPWWFTSESNKLCLNVRYGARLIELTKGKATIELDNQKELINTLQLIKSAVEVGELDNQIEALSGTLRAGFGK
jgi:hypothetical protein